MKTKIVHFFLAFSLLTAFTSYGQEPELVVQMDHSSGVNSVVFSSDGKVLASGSTDHTIKIWDAEKGMELKTLVGHSASVNSVSFSPDSKKLASASSDTVKIWDVEKGVVITTLAGHSIRVNSVSFSPDGKKLASASYETIKIWDVEKSLKIITTLESNTGDVNSVSFSPDGRKLASGNSDNTIKIWDVEKGKEIKTLEGHSSDVNSVTFSPNGKMLASASGDYPDHDNTVKIWDVEKGVEITTLEGHSSYVNSVSFSTDGKKLASASGDDDNQGDKTLIIWDVETAKKIVTLKGHSTYIASVSFSPDGKKLASASGHLGNRGDKKVKIWDVEKGVEITTIKGHSSKVNSVSFSPDGRRLALASGEFGDRGDNTVKIWNLEKAKEITTPAGHSGQVTSVSYSPDGKKLASASHDKTVKIWDVEKAKVITTLRGHTKWVGSVSISPDGKKLASAGGDKTIKIWDMEKGVEITTLKGHSSVVFSVSFSPDGKKLASTTYDYNDNTIKMWDVEKGLEITSLFSRESKKLASEIRNLKRDLKKGKENRKKEYWSLSGQQFFVTSFSFSPDGKKLAIARYYQRGDNELKIWDVEKGVEIISLAGHSSKINSVSFSPDGKKLASASSDNTVKIWDVEKGLEITTLAGHSAEVWSVSFSPDGEMLASISWDMTTRIWDLETDKELWKLISLGKESWAIVTPDNYYTCSKNAIKGVHFVKGLDVYTFENFDLIFNRPDRVLQRLGTADTELINAYYKAYQKRLKLMGVKENEISTKMHLPEVKIITENLPYQTNQSKISFSIKASDSEYKLDRINVYINDVPIYGMQGISLRNRKISEFETTFTVELSQGSNKIQVSAHNEKAAESHKQTFEIVCNKPYVNPDLYLIAVGVSQYQKMSDLRFADNDAKELKAFFADKTENIKLIVNNDAIKENILATKEMLMQTKVDDKVILFLAGHGMLDDNFNYYFATTDIDPVNPMKRGLPYEQVEGLLDGIPALKKLLLMDTCHSGEVDKDEAKEMETAFNTKDFTPEAEVSSETYFVTARNVIPINTKKKLGLENTFYLLQELFADLRRTSGSMVISAAGGLDYALEREEMKNGVFTYALLNGLKGEADTDGKNGIQVSELRDYVIDKVEEFTQGQQKPVMRRENLEFDFRVY